MAVVSCVQGAQCTRGHRQGRFLILWKQDEHTMQRAPHERHWVLRDPTEWQLIWSVR